MICVLSYFPEVRHALQCTKCGSSALKHQVLIISSTENSVSRMNLEEVWQTSRLCTHYRAIAGDNLSAPGYAFTGIIWSH